MNPFEPPDGAIVLDTTDLDIEDDPAAALEIVAREAPELSP